MTSHFMIYGATGFVGSTITRLAVMRGLRPIIAGRNPEKLASLATELDLEYQSFNLDEPNAVDSALKNVVAVLNCAGPFIHTFKPIVESCLRQGTHYLDLTGEPPVYEALGGFDSQAIELDVMILPAVGFDVVPTDCLALHLKQRLPSATHLTLAFHTKGPAGLPPGTARTMIELIPYGNRIRQNGQLVTPPKGIKTRMIDFGEGPVQAIRLTWGDVFTAHYSTGIANIEDYAVLPADLVRQIKATEYLRPLFSLPAVQRMLRKTIKPGPTLQEREQTQVSVWGEVTDEQGRKVEARLHGPEAGVTWTSLSALAAIERVLGGDIQPGFQTPAKVYGADFVLACEGVTREDLH
ncbi:MAG: saccharopine dehydrogenase NADP-binding domain-containing protein [Pseudomonadota bacterium]